MCQVRYMGRWGRGVIKFLDIGFLRRLLYPFYHWLQFMVSLFLTHLYNFYYGSHTLWATPVYNN